jgi:hypothetical protein
MQVTKMVTIIDQLNVPNVEDIGDMKNQKLTDS